MRIESKASFRRVWASFQGMHVHRCEFPSYSCYIAQYFVCTLCPSGESHDLLIWEPQTAQGTEISAFQVMEILHSREQQ